MSFRAVPAESFGPELGAHIVFDKTPLLGRYCILPYHAMLGVVLLYHPYMGDFRGQPYVGLHVAFDRAPLIGRWYIRPSSTM
eukprot:2629496-Pyramimonas_sp.AAC.1